MGRFFVEKITGYPGSRYLVSGQQQHFCQQTGRQNSAHQVSDSVRDQRVRPTRHLLDENCQPTSTGKLHARMTFTFKRTSRDRPKSVLYLRLKNTKGLQNVLVNLEPFMKFFLKKVSKRRKKLKVRTLWDFSTSILFQNSKKMKGDLLVEKKLEKKVAQCRKKSKEGTL